MSEISFRDFAGAIMRGDATAAASALEQLLGLSAGDAASATEHFRGRMSDPSFMPKAMGLRTAVTTGSDDDIRALLGDCFGLDDARRTQALAALRTRYPAA
ncbi:MAG TPA: hypothetical protein VFQ53_12385 [Kofleriaceae bacterium]|nr:hypothetical protein [Kofleriaceae bacterium]